MPVILKPESYDEWLDAKMKDTDKLQKLLAPYPAKQMNSHTVSKSVNIPDSNSPELISHSIICNNTMDYLVLDTGFNYGKDDAGVMFATKDKDESIETAKDFGSGTHPSLKVFVNSKANNIFIQNSFASSN